MNASRPKSYTQGQWQNGAMLGYTSAGIRCSSAITVLRRSRWSSYAKRSSCLCSPLTGTWINLAQIISNPPPDRARLPSGPAGRLFKTGGLTL